MTRNGIIPLFALILLISCASKTPSDVKIGGLFALTGYASWVGEASRDGFLLAMEDSGMKIPYSIEDDQSDLKTTATAASKLIDVDGVSVVIGPEWAEFGEIIFPISIDRHTLFISPWMTFEYSSDKIKYYLSATPNERIELHRLTQYMTSQGVKRLVLVYSNNAWSFGNIQIMKDELQKAGIEVLEEFKINDEDKDFRTEILRIKALQPDAIYFAIATDDGQGTFDRQLADLEVHYPMYIPYARGGSEVFLDHYGRYAEGTVFPAPKPYKNMEAFTHKYEKRFGKKPSAISAATAYDMTTLVLKAIQSGATTSEQIRDYLLSLKGYEGYSNLITFQDGHVASEDVVIKQIREGKSDVVG
ncbi:MAG: ABC transporter substrate-binding protein [Nanoarchaeota archaeon]